MASVSQNFLRRSRAQAKRVRLEYVAARRALLALPKDAHYLDREDAMGKALDARYWATHWARRIVLLEAQALPVGGMYCPSAQARLRSQGRLRKATP